LTKNKKANPLRPAIAGFFMQYREAGAGKND
jgi:hypothetical protein